MDDELLSVPRDWLKAFAMFRAQIIAPLVDPLSTPEEKRQWRRFVTSRERVSRRKGAADRRTHVAQLGGGVSAGRLGGIGATEGAGNGPRKLNPDHRTGRTAEAAGAGAAYRTFWRIIEAERGEPLDITARVVAALAKAGLGARGAVPPAGLRRWEANGPNQLWQGDVKHGPYLPTPSTDRMRKTYLMRSWTTTVAALCTPSGSGRRTCTPWRSSFKKALLRKATLPGLCGPRMIYQSRVFRNACMELGVRHISSTAYRPNGKGKIEKFWQCVDNEFLLELEHRPVQDLAEMNRRFQAWLEEVYHQRKHSETGQTPTARFASVDIAPLERPERLAELFLWRVKRTVDKTGCVSFEGNVYQVEPGLERRKVELRYHPLISQRLKCGPVANVGRTPFPSI